MYNVIMYCKSSRTAAAPFVFKKDLGEFSEMKQAKKKFLEEVNGLKKRASVILNRNPDYEAKKRRGLNSFTLKVRRDDGSSSIFRIYIK